MLIYTRKPNQKIVIEVGDIKVTVQIGTVKGDKIQLRVDAPDAVRVYRAEKPKGNSDVQKE